MKNTSTISSNINGRSPNKLDLIDANKEKETKIFLEEKNVKGNFNDIIKGNFENDKIENNLDITCLKNSNFMENNMELENRATYKDNSKKLLTNESEEMVRNDEVEEPDKKESIDNNKSKDVDELINDESERIENKSEEINKGNEKLIKDQSNEVLDRLKPFVEDIFENQDEKTFNAEVNESTRDSSDEIANSPIITDEMIIRALSIKKKRQAENNYKAKKMPKFSNSESKDSHNKIFTERPFFQRLTDSIYRRLIIGSSNQIKLVGLISAARLLVHLYETNTLEIPETDGVQYNIPLLNCHVGDWQPIDSEKMILSNSNISREILGSSKTSHTPPLINRTRSIYIVTPLNYDGNKVGGGYRGGGSDPLSRLVMKWRNLSVSDVQDFSYVTENGFDLKYNGFYVLYAKSNKPGSLWKQFYSARMRTSAFNNRHQILINSTHSSKLIKLHTVHLQKDGIDLPIGMALFEDHTESLTTEDFRKDYSIQYMNDLNNLNDGNSQDKNSNNAEKIQINDLKSLSEHTISKQKYNETEFNKFNNVNSNPISNENFKKFNTELSSSINLNASKPNNLNNNTGTSNSNINNTNNNNLFNNIICDPNALFTQNQLHHSNFFSSFAKDSHELSLLLNFRSLPPKIQGDFLHAISCVRFLNQDIFSTILRSSLDTAYISSGYNDSGLTANITSNNASIFQPTLNSNNNLDKTQIEFPLFFKLLQDRNSEHNNNNGNIFHYLQNPQLMGSINTFNDINKYLVNHINSTENQSISSVTNIGNSVLPILWSSVFGSQPINNNVINKNIKTTSEEKNYTTLTSETTLSDPNARNFSQIPNNTISVNMKASSSNEN